MERGHPGGWGALGTLLELGAFSLHLCTAAVSAVDIAALCVLFSSKNSQWNGDIHRRPFNITACESDALLVGHNIWRW